MEEIEVSVIIPVFNRTFELQRAIKSVLNQTYNNYEIIVVDDCSTINIENVIKDFNNSRIKIIKHKTNKGAGAARNTGVNYAKGKYIALLDSDDEWLPNHLELCIGILKKDNAFGIYGSVIQNLNNTAQSITNVRATKENEMFSDYLLSGALRACTPSLVLQREAFMKIRFDEKLKQLEDYDFNIRFEKKYSYEVNLTPTVIVHRNTNSDSSLSYTINGESYLHFYNKNYHNLSSKNRKSILMKVISQLDINDSVYKNLLVLFKNEKLKKYTEVKFYLYYRYPSIKKVLKLLNSMKLIYMMFSL